MGRNRIEFPFNPNGSNTFTGTVNFSSIVNFTPGSSVSVQGGWTFLSGFSFQGAGEVADFLNGTITRYEPGSTMQVLAGSIWNFANIPTFSAGITFDGTSTLSTYNQNIEFTPTANAFTIVNGTGGVTFNGTYTKIGTFVHVLINAILTGTATLAATTGVSNFTPPAGLTPAFGEANHAIDLNNTNYGHGLTRAAGLFSPTIVATTGGGEIFWSFDYLTAT